LERAGARVAQQKLAQAALAVEVAGTGKIPVQPDRADVGRADDVIAADVIGLERAGRTIAQKHVAAVASLECAERGKRLPDRADRRPGLRYRQRCRPRKSRYSGCS